MKVRQILLAASLGFSITFLIGIILYPILKKMKMSQVVLSYVTEHKSKNGTPTMGGLMFILGIPISYFIMKGFDFLYANIVLAALAGFGLIGFLDDFIKIKFNRNLGLKAYQKIVGQTAIAVIIACFLYVNRLTEVRIPFTEYVLDLGFWIIPLSVFIMLACTNSVNLTDGLDGLSAGVSLVYVIAFLMMIYLIAAGFSASGIMLATEFQALTVLSAASVGALCAFLTFNCYPARIFMGDTGSMALGALCAGLGLLSGLELFIPIVGIMFIVSSLSVIIQVVSFKSRGKRVFLMAPFHHHLQEKGMSETKVATTYMIITAIAAAMTIAFSF